ncbi:MAG: zinc-binding dehydrogenase [Candidatus Eisenbacteria bacterium]|nr:zinc-binding dehydrogenase [Candidatus Eisenbacteria bacterium]
MPGVRDAREVACRDLARAAVSDGRRSSARCDAARWGADRSLRIAAGPSDILGGQRYAMPASRPVPTGWARGSVTSDATQREDARMKAIVNSAGGGVGTFALQIAKLHDAEVAAVGKTDKLAMLGGLGADHLIDYTREDFTKTGTSYDLILDVKTNRSPFTYGRALAPGGRYVTVGGDTGRLLQALVLGPFVRRSSGKHLRIVALKPNKNLAYLSKQFEAGTVVPGIDRAYGPADVPQALIRFGTGGSPGQDRRYPEGSVDRRGPAVCAARPDPGVRVDRPDPGVCARGQVMASSAAGAPGLRGVCTGSVRGSTGRRPATAAWAAHVPLRQMLRVPPDWDYHSANGISPGQSDPSPQPPSICRQAYSIASRGCSAPRLHPGQNSAASSQFFRRRL